MHIFDIITWLTGIRLLKITRSSLWNRLEYLRIQVLCIPYLRVIELECIVLLLSLKSIRILSHLLTIHERFLFICSQNIALHSFWTDLSTHLLLKSIGL